MKTPTDPKLPCDHLFKRAVDKALERPIVTGSDEFRSYIEWYLGPSHVEVSCDFFTVINRSATALSQSYSQFYLLYIFAKLLTKSSEVAGMLQGYSAPYKRYKDKQRLRGPQPCNQEGGVAGVGEGEGL